MELFTAEGIAEKVKLSPYTIRRLGYAGLIREYRYGKAVRFCLEEVVSLMAKQGLEGMPKKLEEEDHEIATSAGVK